MQMGNRQRFPSLRCGSQLISPLKRVSLAWQSEHRIGRGARLLSSYARLSNTYKFMQLSLARDSMLMI